MARAPLGTAVRQTWDTLTPHLDVLHLFAVASPESLVSSEDIDVFCSCRILGLPSAWNCSSVGQ